MSDVDTKPDAMLALLGMCFTDDLPDDVQLAGVPLAYARALSAAGLATDYVEAAAASGWAFSFAYRPGDPSAAYTPLRGLPGHGGSPPQSFRWLVDQLGYGYDSAWLPRTDEFWDYARANIDGGVPIMAEHEGGGLLCGYRGEGDGRQVWFVGPDYEAWLGIVGLGPFDCCVLEAKWDAAREGLPAQSLRRAVSLASMDDYGGTPQGSAALRLLRDDLADAGPDCVTPTVLARLHARKCAAVWLRRVADGRQWLTTAADRYDAAYGHYAALGPDRCGPEVVDAAIAEEERGLAALREAVAGMGGRDEG